MITWQKESTVNPRFIFLVIASVLILVPGTLVNINMQRNFDSGFYVAIGKQYSLYNALRGSNEEFLKTLTDTSLSADVGKVHDATIETLRKLEDTERKMINASEGKPGTPAAVSQAVTETENGLIFSFDRLNSAFHPDPVKMFLLPGCSEREAVMNDLSAYSALAKEILPETESSGIEALLNASAFLPGNNPDIKRIPLIVGLFNLEVIKTNVLLAESAMLKELSGLTR